jgi:hypothetical protein
VTRKQMLAVLRPLLELPVELVSRRTGRRPTEPPSSTRSPDARAWFAGRIVVEVPGRLYLGHSGPFVAQPYRL